MIQTSLLAGACRILVKRMCVMWMILLSSACGTDVKDHASAIPTSCTTIMGGEAYFIGEPRCLSALPKETISGYWVSGHEYSVFYVNGRDIQSEPDANATWMYLSSDAEESVSAVVRAGVWQVFALKFVGSMSTKRGVYGPGPFKSGVLAHKVLEVKEIEVRR